tara:strand:- start:1579 stop:2244 length:666 start_codon:yes stop_codon:yes gene_type:complete
MRWLLLAKITLLNLFLNIPLSYAGQCSRDEVCALTKKMNPFAVLDKCPMAANLIRDCKNFDLKQVQNLIHIPEFIDKGDTILDQANLLLWSRTEFSEKPFKYKDAVRVVSSARISGRTDWRLPTLPELKSLLQPRRKKNGSGKRSYIHPIFNDGKKWNEYWTTTTCEEVTVYAGKRYGTKNCQEGENGVWFVHFKLGTISWSFKKSSHWIWVVADVKEASK